MITWRGVGVDRLEQVRMHVSGLRIKAYGRIIAAATDESEAFSASYELITNEVGVTKRLSIHLLRESGESQLGLSHDDENLWLVRTDGDTIRSDFDASVSALQWTTAAYTVVLASLLMLGGSTADRLGRARVFMFGLALFTAAREMRLAG